MSSSQHGVITRPQLLGLGVGASAIRRWIAAGRLHPVWSGVYAFGRPDLSRHGRWMAAVLSCGPEAVLSHGSAAALWGMRPATQDDIEISIPARLARRRPGIVIHRRANLTARDVALCRDIRVTSPACTLLDVAVRLHGDHLERSINEASNRGLIDPEDLRAELDNYEGWRGVAPLRQILDRRTFALSASKLERRFLPLTRRAGLPLPQTRRYVNGFEVDFYWPDLGLVVETDSLRYHRTPAQQARDRLRDQAHAAAGFVPLRFTHAQVAFDPDHVLATLKAVARRLG